MREGASRPARRRDVPPVRRALRIAASAAACGTLIGGCGTLGADTHRPAAESGSLTVSSPAFRDDEPIPTRYTCTGTGVNPALHWSGLPSDTRSIAVVVDDPDAPDGAYVHWVVFDIAPRDTEIPEDSLPSGAQQAAGTNGRAVYTPPCPDEGVHHYRFSVYALDSSLTLPDDATLEAALDAIPHHAIAHGRLTGIVRK